MVIGRTIKKAIAEVLLGLGLILTGYAIKIYPDIVYEVWNYDY